MARILHVITTLEEGGAENQLLYLVREQVKVGHAVSVYPLKGALSLTRKFECGGVRVISRFSNKPFFIQLIKTWMRPFKDYDVVHAHLPRAEILAASARGSHQLVLSRHNAEPFFPGAPAVLSRLLSRAVVRRSTQLIAITYAVRDFLVESKEVQRSQRIHVVHYGFPEKSEEFNSDVSIDSELNLSASDFVLGTIGRLVPQKDYPTLLTGFSIARRSHPQLKLIILGDGHMDLYLRDLSKRLGIDESIRWVGKKENVFPYLMRMDGFILASRYEGLGMVLLEAMAFSVPILASNNQAHLEVLGQDHPAFFDIGDANGLSKLILDLVETDLSDAIISCSDQRSTHFGLERMGLEIEKIYIEKCS